MPPDLAGIFAASAFALRIDDRDVAPAAARREQNRWPSPPVSPLYDSDGVLQPWRFSPRHKEPRLRSAATLNSRSVRRALLGRLEWLRGVSFRFRSFRPLACRLEASSYHPCDRPERSIARLTGRRSPGLAHVADSLNPGGASGKFSITLPDRSAHSSVHAAADSRPHAPRACAARGCARSPCPLISGTTGAPTSPTRNPGPPRLRSRRSAARRGRGARLHVRASFGRGSSRKRTLTRCAVPCATGVESRVTSADGDDADRMAPRSSTSRCTT